VNRIGLVIVALLSLIRAAPAVAGPAQRGDVRKGWHVFIDKSCSRCHAIWGEGGELGPDLGRTRAGGLTDAELAAAMWNHVPRMWGKMQEEGIPHVAITDKEMGDLFSFLSFVRALDEPGNADAGRRLLDEKKCSICHIVGDERGGVAPDLRRWAKYRNPAAWAQLMFEHAPKMMAQMREKGLAPPKLEPRELVHIVTYVRSLSATDDAELFDPGDPTLGGTLFKDRGCIKCHSVRGQGGKVGPDLGRPGWTQSFTGVAIQTWNHASNMRSAMAERRIPVPTLTPQEMAHVISYLFDAVYSDEPGSAKQGTLVLRGKGCVLCHDGAAAPSFDKLRGKTSPVVLAQALWAHGPGMLERMHELNIRWPSLTGEDMRDIVAALNAPAP
jgi:cytochrome c2